MASLAVSSRAACSRSFFVRLLALGDLAQQFLIPDLQPIAGLHHVFHQVE